MLSHVIATAREAGASRVQVVYGHGGDRVLSIPDQAGVEWVEQKEQLGTGHAVAQALESIGDDCTVLVLYGDVPLLRATSLKPLIESAAHGSLALLTVVLHDPSGYGRIIRDASGSILRIVEDKEADSVERAVQECNTGIVVAPAARLRTWAGALENHNTQGEYYLTDVVSMATMEGCSVDAHIVEDSDEVQGANNRIQLAQLERALQARKVRELMLGGASLVDPARVDVRGSVTTGQDCLVDVNVIFEGRVELGNDVQVGPNCLVRDSRIRDGARIHANSVLEGAEVGPGCEVGPFARLRPGAVLLSGAKVGNFVEVKKAILREGAKVNHLSYVGDADIGRTANVGAGTITCNYDGANKHRTIVGDGAFIGSNAALVAPVKVGAGATVGAGSTVSRNVPPDSLVITRAKERTVSDWKRPTKKRE